MSGAYPSRSSPCYYAHFRHSWYYRYKPSRVSLCLSTFHALLHIVPSIRQLGPPWVYWEWFMERFCGRLGPVIHSQTNPWLSIDTYIIVEAQLNVVCLRFNTTPAQLRLRPPPAHSKAELTNRTHCTLPYIYSHYLRSNAYFTDPLDILMPPCHALELNEDETRLIALFLHRFTGVARATCRSIIPASLPQYAKLRVDDGGDTIHAREMVRITDRSRDASFVRVSTGIISHDSTSKSDTGFVVFSLRAERRRARLVGATQEAISSRALLRRRIASSTTQISALLPRSHSAGQCCLRHG
jgi:hypothetical protein